MTLRYRWNVTIQLGFGAICFLLALVWIQSLLIPLQAVSLIGATMIGFAGMLLSGFRLRKKIHTIYILVGHPDPDNNRFCHQLADAYQHGAEEKGYSVRRTNLGDLSFDPILRHGYEVIQECEDDLKQVQADIKWADHIVLFYPNWWSSMPAQLKGLFDRIWLPGFAFQFHTVGWSKLLKGRTARVFLTLDNITPIAYLFFGDYTNEIRNAILEFAGIAPTDITRIGRIKFRSKRGIQRQITRLYRMGRRAL